MGSFCPNYVQFQLKKYRRVMFYDTDPELKEKLTFCLKNYMRNLTNFNLNSKKSENLHFDEIFQSKVCNVSAEKI